MKWSVFQELKDQCLYAPVLQSQAISSRKRRGKGRYQGCRTPACRSRVVETLDYEEVARTIGRLGVRAEERNKVRNDPFAADMISDIDRQMKKLAPAERETIKQFVIYGELSTAGAKSKVKDTGIDMAKWSVPQHLAGLTGWLVPRPGNTPYDDMQQNVYSINPTLRPLLRTYFSREK